MDKTVEAQCDFLDYQNEVAEIIIALEDETPDYDTVELNKFADLLNKMQANVNDMQEDIRSDWQATLDELKENYLELCKDANVTPTIK